MISSVRNINQYIRLAVEQKRLVRLGRCVSGVLGSDPVYSHLALATLPGFEKLHDQRIQQQVMADLQRNALSPGSFSFPEISVRIYNSERPQPTFGVCLATAEDVEEYCRHEEQLLSRDPGVHRDVYLAMRGIMSKGVTQLTERFYRKLIGTLETLYQEQARTGIKQEISTVIVIDDVRNSERAIRSIVPGGAAAGKGTFIFLTSELADAPLSEPKFFTPPSS